MRKRKSSFQTKRCACVSLGLPFLRLSNNCFTNYSFLTHLMTFKLLNLKTLLNASYLQIDKLMSIASSQDLPNQVLNQASQSTRTIDKRNQEHSSNVCKALNYSKKSKNRSRVNNQISNHSHQCSANCLNKACHAICLHKLAKECHLQ